jgi:hypothetical protein
MAFIRKIRRDGKSYDVGAKNLQNDFTQTEAGVNALDAAAGKSLNDSLANRLRFGIGSNGDNTSYPRAELKSEGNVSIGKTMTLRYSPDANNYTDAILCDKDGNLLPDYATKTDLSNRVSVFSPSPGAVTTVTIKADENIMLIAGRRGTNAFLAVLDIWNSNPIYLYTAGAHPTIINNSGTVTITNDANVGSYPFIVIR